MSPFYKEQLKVERNRVINISKISLVEENMLCPRYVLKIIKQNSNETTLRLYYTV